MKEEKKFENGVLIDACAFADALLTFRTDHPRASELFRRLTVSDIVCYVPSHAYFELVVACLTHLKHEPQKLRDHPIDPEVMPELKLKIVNLDNDSANRFLRLLSGGNVPDLKSQDMIYFCIALDRGLTLITQDKKLRHAARNGGIQSFNVSEALEILDRDNAT